MPIVGQLKELREPAEAAAVLASLTGIIYTAGVAPLLHVRVQRAVPSDHESPDSTLTPSVPPPGLFWPLLAGLAGCVIARRKRSRTSGRTARNVTGPRHPPTSRARAALPLRRPVRPHPAAGGTTLAPPVDCLRRRCRIAGWSGIPWSL
jgi:hypothetical protein